jgi:HD superfamily phosphohydrolase
MFSEVYWHHAVRSATAMLQRLVYAVGQTESTGTWVGRSDADMASALLESARSDPALLPLATGVFGRQRRLYKRLLGFNFVENPQAHQALARRSYEELVTCSQALAAELSRLGKRPIQAHEVLIDAPPVKLEVQFQLSVRLSSGQYRSLSSLSPVVRALATEQFDNYVKRVHVFIAPDRMDELRVGPEQLEAALVRAIEQVAKR